MEVALGVHAEHPSHECFMFKTLMDTFTMIGIPGDTLRRLGGMLVCRRSWVGIGSISVGAEAPSSDFQTVLYVCLRLARYSTARSEVVTWPPFEFQMFLESRGVLLPSIVLQPKALG